MVDLLPVPHPGGVVVGYVHGVACEQRRVEMQERLHHAVAIMYCLVGCDDGCVTEILLPVIADHILAAAGVQMLDNRIFVHRPNGQVQHIRRIRIVYQIGLLDFHVCT